MLELAGEDVDAIEVKDVSVYEAPFLAKIVSKLSPMVGNLMEQRIVERLGESAPEGYEWVRQDLGFEIKAWYVLSTEFTGQFKKSQNLLADKSINVAIVAWRMSHLEALSGYDDEYAFSSAVQSLNDSDLMSV